MHALPTFQVLGGLAAWRGTDEHGASRPVELGGPKQRRVLAALLLSPGRPILPDRLVELVWGEDPPPRARASLQAYVSKLRTQLGSEVLVLRPGGYVLDVAPEAIDVVRWERRVDEAAGLAASGAHAAAAELLSNALDAWAPLLPELHDASFARGCVERVAARRRTAIELLATCRLQLGEVHAAEAGLAAAVADDPRSERLWALLATARHRLGRAADALATVHRARAELAERCGLDPGPELQAIERAILANGPGDGNGLAPLPEAHPSHPTRPVPPAPRPAAPPPALGAGRAAIGVRHGGTGDTASRRSTRRTCRRSGSGTGTGRGARR